jgi:SAM-dependent methyltransferase
MRILKANENISYVKTQEFFRRRIDKYNSDNPYSLTMYQDNHPELVRKRNEKEVSTLLPKLKLDESSKILDVACGIGRWSDAINIKIKKYCGVDFCEDFILLANKRNKDKANRHFYVSKSDDVALCLNKNNEGRFNRILLVGCLVYLNDVDVAQTLDGIESACEENTIICIREPIGLNERLTLKEHFSEELGDCYNAIYRTRNELVNFFENTLINKGFRIEEERLLFEDQALNNRKETAQYYFILKRGC